MRKIIVSMALLLCGFNAVAADRVLIAKGSDIAFSFTQMNVPVQGHFEKFSGTFNFDPARPEAASIAMQVDVASISAGADTDVEAVKPEWLSAKAFPQATFVSNSVKSLGSGHYVATGAFSLKGTTRNLTVPFDFKEGAGGVADVNGQFVLKRSDFKVGEGEWSAFDIVANEVAVKFHLVLGPAIAKR